MNIWFRLSPEEVEDFQVPAPVAHASKNKFFGTAPLTNLYFDGPWLLLSFQEFQPCSAVVTFQPCAIEFSFINEFERFNPLAEMESSTLNLSRQETQGLIDLLTTLATQMPNNRQHIQPAFTQIDPSQWTHFHLTPTPDLLSRQKVYLQTRDPAVESRESTMVSLIILTTPLQTCTRRGFSRRQPLRYQVQLRQFSLDALQDPEFDPITQGHNGVELDRYSLLDLADVLQSTLKETAVSPSSLPTRAAFAADYVRPVSAYTPA